MQLKDMRTLQVRSYITLDDGQYHFSGLRIDVDYELSAKSGETMYRRMRSGLMAD